MDVNKDSSRKAKTKDSGFVLKDNQGPRTKTKDNIPVYCAADSGLRSHDNMFHLHSEQ